MYRAHRFCNAIPRYRLPEYRWQKYRETSSVTFVRIEFVAIKQDDRVDRANIARFSNVALVKQRYSESENGHVLDFLSRNVRMNNCQKNVLSRRIRL